MKLLFKYLLRSSCWSIFVFALLISAYTHWRAGFTFPHPGIDEPWYLWTSVELCDTGHWDSPSLRPDKPLILSPLFAASNAFVFKLFGIDLSVARWFSWVCTALAGLAILYMARRHPWPWFSAFIVLLFLLGPPSVIAGNMARPEAMLWMLTTWGFAFLERGKIGLGLLFVALCMNLHILGFVFFAGAVCLALLQVFFFMRAHPWTTEEKIWLFMAAAVATALIIYNIVSFDYEIFSSTIQENPTSLCFRLWSDNRWCWLLFGCIAWLYCAFVKREYICFLSLAILGLVPQVLRAKDWYGFYGAQGYGMLLLGVFWTTKDLIQRVHPRWGSGAVAIALGMLICAYRLGAITGPRNYPDKLQWGRGDTIEKTPPVYLTPEDKTAVISELAEHLADCPHPSRPIRVFFCPEADGLFFHGLLPDGAIPYLGVRTDVPGDISIFRYSRHMPQWIQEKHEQKLWHVKSKDSPLVPFHSREGSEFWFFLDCAPLADPFARYLWEPRDMKE